MAYLQSAQNEYCKHDKFVNVNLGKTPQQTGHTIIQFNYFIPQLFQGKNERTPFACTNRKCDITSFYTLFTPLLEASVMPINNI